MGGQNSWCIQRQKGEQNKYNDGNNYTPIAGKPYTVTPETLSTYNQLRLQYNGNDYLSVKTNNQEDKLVRYLDGYFKLQKYDGFYNGEWKGIVPHGRGRVIFPDGSLLIGTFQNNFCVGDDCYLIFKEGSYYRGTIAQNKLSGKGKLISKTVEYDGLWVDNLPQGLGIQSFSNGDKYIGNFQSGMKHGTQSTFIWNDHHLYRQYKGSFKSGKISGFGELFFKTDMKIQGIFDDQQITKSILTCNRCKFQGNFKHGKVSGRGKIQIFDLRQTYDGNFREGQLYGKCKITDIKQRQNQIYFFKGKQLRKVVGMRDSQVQQLVIKIEKCYQNVKKHSDALLQLNEQLIQEQKKKKSEKNLPQQIKHLYEYKFIEPFENNFSFDSYIIVDIFEKVMLVRMIKI